VAVVRGLKPTFVVRTAPQLACHHLPDSRRQRFGMEREGGGSSVDFLWVICPFPFATAWGMEWFPALRSRTQKRRGRLSE
jgi:hypothetical protein